MSTVHYILAGQQLAQNLEDANKPLPTQLIELTAVVTLDENEDSTQYGVTWGELGLYQGAFTFYASEDATEPLDPDDGYTTLDSNNRSTVYAAATKPLIGNVTAQLVTLRDKHIGDKVGNPGQQTLAYITVNEQGDATDAPPPLQQVDITIDSQTGEIKIPDIDFGSGLLPSAAGTSNNNVLRGDLAGRYIALLSAGDNAAEVPPVYEPLGPITDYGGQALQFNFPYDMLDVDDDPDGDDSSVNKFTYFIYTNGTAIAYPQPLTLSAFGTAFQRPDEVNYKSDKKYVAPLFRETNPPTDEYSSGILTPTYPPIFTVQSAFYNKVMTFAIPCQDLTDPNPDPTKRKVIIEDTDTVHVVPYFNGWQSDGMTANFFKIDIDDLTYTGAEAVTTFGGDEYKGMKFIKIPLGQSGYKISKNLGPYTQDGYLYYGWFFIRYTVTSGEANGLTRTFYSDTGTARLNMP